MTRAAGNSRTVKPRELLAQMLARSVGADKAREVVAHHADRLHLGPMLSQADALRLLEAVANETGIVGIAARFAKSRVHLVWTSE